MSRTPDIRFKGFEDNWNEKRLGDVCSEFKSGDAINSQSIEERGLFPVYGGNGLRGFADFYNHDGDYALIGRQGALCGNMNYSKGKAFFTEHAIAVKANSENSTKFLYYLMGVMNLGQYSGQSAQPGLAVGNLIELQSMFPEKREQEEIQNILSTLDTFIEQNQSEVDRLRNLKKAMLLKMFPQKGSKVPEIRFKGFSGDWETKPFKSIAVRVTDFDSDARLPHVEYEDLNAGEGTLNKDLSKKECNKKGLVFDKGDVLYGKLRPYLHNWLLPTFKGIAVGDFWVLRPVETDAGFLYCLIRTADYDTVANQSSGTKMPRADWKLVSATEYQIPKSIDEQHLIGQYFQDLDSLIEQRQSNTDRLRHLKQAMLQRMFI